MDNYKLRHYKRTGSFKGDLDYEEFFETKEQMDNRYNEVFIYEDYSLNPTAWKKVEGEWIRLESY